MDEEGQDNFKRFYSVPISDNSSESHEKESSKEENPQLNNLSRRTNRVSVASSDEYETFKHDCCCLCLCFGCDKKNADDYQLQKE